MPRHSFISTRVTKAAGLLAIFLALLTMVTPRAHAAAIDLNGNGMSDVWEMIYNAAALAPGLDTDGDGATNLAESIAGTDPRSLAAVLKVTPVSFAANRATISWPTVRGKHYLAQSCTSLGGAWTTFATVEGDGATATAAQDSTGQIFLRVVAEDIDSDGDFVSDAEERMLGYNPFQRETAQGVADLTAAYAALTGSAVVTVAATDATGAETGGDNARFIVSRYGKLDALNVAITLSGPALNGTDYNAIPTTVSFPAGVTAVNVDIVPRADALSESAEAVTLTINAGAGYTLGSKTTASAIITDTNVSAGTGLMGSYYAFWTAQTLTYTQLDPTINFDWGSGAPAGFPPRSGVDPREDVWRIHWAGQVQPPFTADYTFFLRIDDGARLWINGQLIIDQWSDHYISEFSSTVIRLQAGVKYDIRLEYYEHTNLAVCQMSWQAAGLPKQIVPQSALFPGASSGPPTITSATDAVALVGAAFSYQITASGAPVSFNAAGLPPGLTLNTGTGAISGTPSVAGNYVAAITATNAAGSGSALLALTIPQTDGSIRREQWNGTFAKMAEIPVATNPAGTSLLTSLEAVGNAGENFGARIRGYLTPLVTGIYTFWIAGDEAAEFWLSTDAEPVSKTRRCFVASATGVRAWTAQAAQKSMPIRLVAGRRYYLEVMHREVTGADHVAVGWLRPDQTGTGPSEVVPGYVLSSYTAPTATPGTSTIYTASLTPQIANTTGSGSSTLTLGADERSATIKLAYSNLTTPKISAHVHDASRGGLILFDFDTAQPVNGSYTWTLQPIGAISVAAIVQTIKSGSAYVNVHSARYPDGEIIGTYRLAAGSQTFTAPPPPPALPGGAPTANEAARFLTQSSFGPTAATIAAVQSQGYAAYLDAQLAAAASYHYDEVASYGTHPDANVAWGVWWKRGMTAPDQLRQRVAFALSQIFVVSEDGTTLENRQHSLATYYDLLLRNAFGSFRTLFQEVTLNPAMGDYLNMRGNAKPDPVRGTNPNENFGREALQLFSVGVNKLHPDGTLKLDSTGSPIATYGQEEVVGFSHVFTGWNYAQAGTEWYYLTPDLINPMKLIPAFHSTQAKPLLDNVVLPANQDANLDLQNALDAICNHPNVGPFIARQLIQRLVTSNPSPAYVYRVAAVFDDNGAGVRGDLKAVVRALLLDYEARSASFLTHQGFGKQKEPLIRVISLGRACNGYSPDNRFYMYRTDQLGQTPLRAPTVFNFYEPGYALPGDIAKSGLVSPEFQITSETTAITSSNFINTGIYSASGFQLNAMLLNLSGEQALAGNPTQLVESLNTRLMAGGMSPEMKARVIAFVSSISSTDTVGRARAAVHLIATSPEFAIQK